MAQLDTILPYVFSHQVVIIEGLFATILGIIVLWLFSHLREESAVKDEKGDLRDIEAALKRVLENTNVKTMATLSPEAAKGVTPVGASSGASAVAASAPAEAPPAAVKPALTPLTPAASPAPVAAGAATSGSSGATNLEDVTKLKKQLEDKSQEASALERALSQVQDELKKAQQALAQAAQSPSPTAEAAANAAMSDLLEKVAVLEARLREYEIIEDDIANLTIYKTENAKLKEEVERLKSQLAAHGTGEHSARGTSTKEAPLPVEKPPIAGDMSRILQAGNEAVNNNANVAQLIEEQGSKDGEKLISDFQNFMKGNG